MVVPFFFFGSSSIVSSSSVAPDEECYEFSRLSTEKVAETGGLHVKVVP